MRRSVLAADNPIAAKTQAKIQGAIPPTMLRLAKQGEKTTKQSQKLPNAPAAIQSYNEG
jgi:hypothetical protein